MNPNTDIWPSYRNSCWRVWMTVEVMIQLLPFLRWQWPWANAISELYLWHRILLPCFCYNCELSAVYRPFVQKLPKSKNASSPCALKAPETPQHCPLSATLTPPTDQEAHTRWGMEIKTQEEGANDHKRKNTQGKSPKYSHKPPKGGVFSLFLNFNK